MELFLGYVVVGVCTVRTVNCLLRMNSYLFETCRGYLLEYIFKKVHLVGFYYAKKTAACFGPEVPSSGSFKFKAVEALINRSGKHNAKH